MNQQKVPLWFFTVLCLFYFFSGTASLAYEIIWMRLLVQQFGVSHFGVAVTVAAFMLGLGLGSYWGRGLTGRIRTPMLMLAVLETLVGVYAVSLSLMFQFSGSLPLSGWLLVDFFIEAVMDILILLPPAFAMGVGFPLVLSLLPAARSSLSFIYAANTFGAVAGALLPLYLLPSFGWFQANRIVAVVSFVLAGVALLLHRRHQPPVLFSGQPVLHKTHYGPLLIYAGIGFATLVLEICWSRLFGLLFLRTEYVMALVLAIYLFGIAAGSFIARFHRQPQTWLNFLPLLAGVGILAGLWMLPMLAQWSRSETIPSYAVALSVYTAVLLLVCFPVSMLFGAWLPLLQQRYFHQVDSGAALYAANSIGAGVGAFAAGFILIPLLGTAGSMVAAAWIILVLGLRLADNPYKVLLTAMVVVASLPVVRLPSTAVLLGQAHQAQRQKDIFYREDALSITHVVEKDDGQRVLLSDLHRLDAASDPTSVELQKNQGRLALLLHPNPHRILFLGVGTGVTAASALTLTNTEITALEISSGALQAATEYFKEINDGVMGKIHIRRADIRRALKRDTASYDVIVGDLFHPDLVGRASLLSLQNFRQVYKRLNDNGIYVQWLALNQFDLPALKVVLRTFAQVFPNAQIYIDGTRIAMVGPRDDVAGLDSRWRAFDALGANQQKAIGGGEGFWTWAGRYMGAISVESGPVQSLWQPVLEFQLPRARYDGRIDVIANLDYLFRMRPTISQVLTKFQLDDERAPALEDAFRATDLSRQAMVARARQQELAAIRSIREAYQANPRDRWVGFALADLLLQLPPPTQVDRQAWLERILAIRPDHMHALQQLYTLKKKQGKDQAVEIEKRILRLHPYAKI